MIHLIKSILTSSALLLMASCNTATTTEKPSELVGQWEGVLTEDMKTNKINRFAIQLDENNEMTQILVKDGKESAIVQNIKISGNKLQTIDNHYESDYLIKNDTLTLTTDKLVIRYVKKK